MSKRPRADSHSEVIHSVLEKIFAIANGPDPEDNIPIRVLKKLRLRVLSAEAEKPVHKAATIFTLAEAVQDFGLTYSSRMAYAEKHWWKIETLPEAMAFQPSPSLVSLLDKYTAIYDRSSESACRIAVDFLLCECMTILRGNVSGISSTQEINDGRCTPTQWDSVKVHCEVSFKHTVNPPLNTQTTIGGRVDHGVGIVVGSNESRKRLFYSLLLCVEAKTAGNLDDAIAQLVVYLACLRQSRINRGRCDASVYGVATDGLRYKFITITHEGVLKTSSEFDIMHGGLPTVLGCLLYILEMAMSRSPHSTPEKGALNKGDKLELDSDESIDLDDNPYLCRTDNSDEDTDDDSA